MCRKITLHQSNFHNSDNLILILYNNTIASSMYAMTAEPAANWRGDFCHAFIIGLTIFIEKKQTSSDK